MHNFILTNYKNYYINRNNFFDICRLLKKQNLQNQKNIEFCSHKEFYEFPHFTFKNDLNNLLYFRWQFRKETNALLSIYFFIKLS